MNLGVCAIPEKRVQKKGEFTGREKKSEEDLLSVSAKKLEKNQEA